VADVAVLSLFSHWFLSIYSGEALLGYLQKIIPIGLISISIWMIYSLSKKSNSSEDVRAKQLYHSSWIAGLLPCSFSWGIFFLLYSLHELQYIFWYLFLLFFAI
jgi:hypothetical protein